VGFTVEIRWTGGAESWWRVKFRDVEFNVPGHQAFEDAMRRVLNEG
jgi:hypothetical protein